ncbi:aldehyde dehydrogenase family protein [Mycobacterium sp. GA-2829]|uniref:aldehyde dehydrogenase family protein n=1 Tax=Mycobacterium sp. GA-2829 TaxID=1772283 RepID=UPI00073FBA0F|nr:aldehyde dehydrogenase family protein [Mycobacterium sp. GA-2829]KUI29307.1 gamma-aminobutyraldehyde dehydrogenase [Mycobacterium sp. GA-2829]
MAQHAWSADEQRSYAAGFAKTVTGNFIDGQWTAAGSTDTIDVFDPSTGGVIGAVPASTAKDVEAAVAAARAAQKAWSKTPPSARSQALLAVVAAVEEKFEEMVALEAIDAGKPVSAVRDDELPGCLDAMRYFSSAGRTLSAQAGGDYLEGITSVMRREPLGVVAGITPWNYPLLQAVAKIFPALITGNTVVIKPAETTPYSTALLVQLAGEVLPAGVLNIVFGTGAVVGDALSRHPEVDVVSFTGSIETGRKVGIAAADGIKKAVMELGGNSPVLVFADADLPAAMDAIAGAGLYNTGQECMSATRVIVQDSVFDEFVAGLKERCAQFVVGDALNPRTTMGPLNSTAQLNRVIAKLENLPESAEIVLGGKRATGDGYFLPPTIIVGADQEDEIVTEEIFGPVFTVQKFTDEPDALAKANGTRYGLASSVFTTNVGVATRVQNELDFGTVWVNNHLVFGPDLPVSGFGHSGIGTENAEAGFVEFTRVKHVMIDGRI